MKGPASVVVFLALVSIGCSERLDRTESAISQPSTQPNVVHADLLRDASPCSQPAYLAGTKLFQQICARSQSVTGESGVQDQCWFHVQADVSTWVQAQLVSSMVCRLVNKTESEIRQEAYNMLSNQLPLDFHETPWAIGYPSTVEHIQELMKLANMLNWKVFVVGGGHGAEAGSFGEGLVLSTLNMHTVQVINGRELEDSARWEGPVLHLQAGVLWAEAYYAAEQAGGLMLGGSCATVGAAGYLMGGGFGYLSGSLGFASDQVLRMNVITADGNARIIDRANHPDLFNAIRGGGQEGLAVVSDVWLRIFPRNMFGCLLKVELMYPQYEDLVDWVFNLMTLQPKEFHLKARFQSDAHISASGWQNRKLGAFYNIIVAITYMGDTSLNSKEAIIHSAAGMLTSVQAGLPIGCDGLFVKHDKDLHAAWSDCLGWSKFDCSSYHVAFGKHGEDQYPVAGTGRSDGAWSWHPLVAAERGLSADSLYTKNYKHRTSVKSVLLRKVTADTFKAAHESMMIWRGFPVYTSFVWWGNGHWGQGTGSVADARRNYAWLVICSADYIEEQQDIGALQWTTEIVDQLRKTVGEEFQPYPNLYDGFHVTVTNGTAKRVEVDKAISLGEAKSIVETAKKKWDPQTRIAGLFGLGYHASMENGLDQSASDWLSSSMVSDSS